MNPDPIIISDPFIGQVEYLAHLTSPEIGRKIPFTEIKFHEGDIDVDILERAIAYLVKRHESLRTIFPKIDGVIRQVILPYEQAKFGLEVVDASVQGSASGLFRRKYYEDAVKSFADPGRGPLVRFFLFKLAKESYLVSMIIHHVICDAWSVGVLKNEMEASYQAYAGGKQPSLDPMPMQLRDYCREKNDYITSNLGMLSGFWKSRLRDYDEMVEVARFYRTYSIRHNDPSFAQKAPVFTDRSAFLQALNRQRMAASFVVYAGPGIFTGIKQLARRSGCSISTVLYASLYIFIFLYTGKRRVLLASLVADRFKSEYCSLVGCLLGGIYLPMEIGEHTLIGGLLERTFTNFEENAGCIINNHTILGIDGHEARMNCDIYLNYIFVGHRLDRNSVVAKPGHKVIDDAYYAVNCKIDEYSDDLSLDWEYNSGLFTGPLIEDMSRYHLAILGYLAGHGTGSVRDVANHLARK